ncbi:ubiquitin conjugating enzyme E2 [Acrasis kona]|uniref:Ubiquitin conjugating enzyme E2 n=1 Tax=Acrasis kona TaxID=1008807 RepID=A0AAW2YPA6_9EUKA
MADPLKKDIKNFIESDDNIGGFELGRIQGNKVEIIDSDREVLFCIIIDGDKITTKPIGELFTGEWDKVLHKFCSSKRTINEVLTKAALAYNDILEADDAEGEDEEEEIEVEVDNIEEEPIELIKRSDSGYNEAFEAAKNKFKKPSDSNEGAVNCIIKEYLKLGNIEETKKYGYSCHPIEDDLFHWEVRLFDFDKNEGLGLDLKELSKKSKQDYISLDVKFPKDFPFSPPFIRVLTPRFKFMTGHVTIGGSICMELLTTSGWRPANSIESIFVQIRCEMTAGGARLDLSNRSPYTEQEAKEAYLRMARKYGWEK